MVKETGAVAFVWVGGAVEGRERVLEVEGDDGEKSRLGVVRTSARGAGVKGREADLEERVVEPVVADEADGEEADGMRFVALLADHALPGGAPIWLLPAGSPFPLAPTPTST